MLYLPCNFTVSLTSLPCPQIILRNRTCTLSNTFIIILFLPSQHSSIVVYDTVNFLIEIMMDSSEDAIVDGSEGPIVAGHICMMHLMELGREIPLSVPLLVPLDGVVFIP